MVSDRVKKKLYALSRNTCAFQGCNEQVWDTSSDSNISNMCHIRSKSEDGPRYDPLYPVEKLDKYENLILFCTIHHGIIDQHPENYTIENLLIMKKQHLDWVEREREKEDIPEELPFNPIEYYPDEICNILSEEIPVIQIFHCKKGISEDKIEYVINNEEFSIDSTIGSKYDRMRKYLENKGYEIGSQPKVRLFDYEIDNENKIIRLHIQKTHYWMGHVSNFNLDLKFHGWGERLRDIVVPGPKIGSLPNSKASNHLGLNCIISTSDNNIILQQRSERVAINPNKLGPSVGGGMDWDFRISTHNPPSLFVGMKREIYEELGIEMEDLSDVRLVAICRELERGGKPTTLFVVETPLSSEEVLERYRIRPKDKWESNDIELVDSNDVERIKHIMYEREDVALETKECLYYYAKYRDLDI